MKNILRTKSIAFALIAATIAISCSEDYIDLQPESSLVSGTLTSAQDAENILTGAYSKIGPGNSYYQYDRFYLTEGINDNHYVNGDNPVEWLLENFNYDASNGVIQGSYTYLWAHVNAANAVLESVPAIEDPLWTGTNRKEQILAEATFLRAMAYYELVTQFGGVPILLTLSNDGNYYPARNTEAEVYAQIIDDLTYAESILPATPYNGEYGRATKGAAQALLAKTYAQMGDYTNTLVYANKVINDGPYTLVSNFANLWGNTHKNTTESIFEIQAPTGGTPYNWFGPDIFAFSEFQFPKRMIGSADLIRAYQAANDNGPRYETTINFQVTSASFNMPVNAWNPTQAIPFMLKYPDTNAFASDDNIVIMRLADIILLAAEANNQLGNTTVAIAQVNQIRSRAQLPNLTVTSQQDVALAILNERRLELVFECTRWNDLKRADRNGYINIVDIINNQRNSANQPLGFTMASDKHQMIFPIPQQDLNLNENLVQNPGYN